MTGEQQDFEIPGSEGEVSVAAMDRLMEDMFTLRAEIDAKGEALTELNKKLMSMQGKAAESLKALGRDSYKSAHGTVSLRKMWRFNLPQSLEEKKKAFQHFKEIGGEELLYKYATINSNSYSSYCNTEWEEWKARGDGMEYRSPHGTEANLSETVTMRKK